MRADRLIALALLLQTRGRLTAEELAARLEVSVRTIYRDLDALSAAGVPVYGEPGRHGGIALREGYRLDLTALNREESRALFLGGLGSLPGPLAELGVGPILDAALRKLSAALPPAGLDEAERARQRLLVDATDWWDSRQPPRATAPVAGQSSHLRTIEEAVWRDRRLRLTYPQRSGPRLARRSEGQASRLLDPYALVAKRGVWYLVAADATGTPPAAPPPAPRVFRVSRVLDAQALDQPSHRPPDFDLAAFWATWCAEFVAGVPSYHVTLRAAPSLAARMARNPVKGPAFAAPAAVPDADGWVTMDLDLEAPEVAAEHLLAYGAQVEVLAPAALRAQLATTAAELAALYGAPRP